MSALENKLALLYGASNVENLKDFGYVTVRQKHENTSGSPIGIYYDLYKPNGEKIIDKLYGSKPKLSYNIIDGIFIVTKEHRTSQIYVYVESKNEIISIKDPDPETKGAYEILLNRLIIRKVYLGKIFSSKLFGLDGTQLVKRKLADIKPGIASDIIVEYMPARSGSTSWGYQVLNYELKSKLGNYKNIEIIHMYGTDYYKIKDANQLCGIADFNGNVLIKPSYFILNRSESGIFVGYADLRGSYNMILKDSNGEFKTVNSLEAITDVHYIDNSPYGYSVAKIFGEPFLVNHDSNIPEWPLTKEEVIILLSKDSLLIETLLTNVNERQSYKYKLENQNKQNWN